MSILPLRVASRRPRPVPTAKRCLDVVLAGSALLVLSPLLVVVGLVIRCTSRGPALFRQERLGFQGRPFTLFKFRTMRVDADDALHRAYVTQLLTNEVPTTGGASKLFKLEGDPRVTPVGRWLRRTSLDELPQLVNVLRGEMSLVGPRPGLAWEAELYRDVDRRRFEVLPGITGLWQVSGRNRLSMREALVLDVQYVDRRSFALDLWIIARTVPTLLRPDTS